MQACTAPLASISHCPARQTCSTSLGVFAEQQLEVLHKRCEQLRKLLLCQQRLALRHEQGPRRVCQRRPHLQQQALLKRPASLNLQPSRRLFPHSGRASSCKALAEAERG